jgi:hypothetical protein
VFKIVAAAYEDGYGFIEEEAGIYLIRPPYISQNKRPASMENVELAIKSYGFARENWVFDDWDSLIQHLTLQLIEKRKEMKASAEQIRQIVRLEPESEVIKWLDKVEQVLIPNREWNASRNLLTNLLKNKVMSSNRALLDRCADLLDRCHAEEDEKVSLDYMISDEQTIADEFPLAVKTYGDEVAWLNQRVQDDKQILFAGVE